MKENRELIMLTPEVLDIISDEKLSVIKGGAKIDDIVKYQNDDLNPDCTILNLNCPCDKEL